MDQMQWCSTTKQHLKISSFIQESWGWEADQGPSCKAYIPDINKKEWGMYTLDIWLCRVLTLDLTEWRLNKHWNLAGRETPIRTPMHRHCPKRFAAVLLRWTLTESDKFQRQLILGARGYKVHEPYDPCWRKVVIPEPFLKLVCPRAELLEGECQYHPKFSCQQNTRLRKHCRCNKLLEDNNSAAPISFSGKTNSF